MSLPVELIEQVIDEVWDPQVPINFQSIATHQTLSSLAHVSHVFRQRLNVHRFSVVSLYRRISSLADIHAFLDLLRSDVWTAPEMGVARHIRKLELILGATDENDALGQHPAIADGSLTTIINTVFRGTEGHERSQGNYTLALYGCTESQSRHYILGLRFGAINPNFISNLESLLDSCIATLEISWISSIPPALLKKTRIKHLTVDHVVFPVTDRSVFDFTALGPWSRLESLDAHITNFFSLTKYARGPGSLDWTLPALKALSLTVKGDVDSIQGHWRHWNLLERLTLNINAESSTIGIDYERLLSLKSLTINFKLLGYGDVIRSSRAAESIAQHIVNVLGPDVLPLRHLEIFIHTEFLRLSLFQDIIFLEDIIQEVVSFPIDACLTRYTTSTVSATTIRFGVKIFLDVGGDLDLENFRRRGVKALQEVFPRLNAGSGRKVYGSVVDKIWKDYLWAGASLHEGTFFVDCNPAT